MLFYVEKHHKPHDLEKQAYTHTQDNASVSRVVAGGTMGTKIGERELGIHRDTQGQGLSH